jgi:integrase
VSTEITKTATAPESPSDSRWQKTPVANLIRYAHTGIYYARMRIRGKLIWKSLKTDRVSVAKLRLGDLEKTERQKAEHQSVAAASSGKMTFGDALGVFRERLNANVNLKPRSKDYREERITLILKTWPEIATKDVKQISRNECQEWAGLLAPKCSSTAYNNTIGTLQMILEICVQAGAIYDNPARLLERKRIIFRRPILPKQQEFGKFVAAIENSGRCSCFQTADLVRFLAYGGFRKSEAAHVRWADCDFEKKIITVRGKPITGTKNSEVRDVPMIPQMIGLLQRLKAKYPDDKRDDFVMKVKECQISMDRAAKEVGMKRITHHHMRHLFATICIESGVDIPTVSRWLGHKDGGALAMKVYGHLRDQHSTAMAAKVIFKDDSTAPN